MGCLIPNDFGDSRLLIGLGFNPWCSAQKSIFSSATDYSLCILICFKEGKMGEERGREGGRKKRRKKEGKKRKQRKEGEKEKGKEEGKEMRKKERKRERE
ncbi:Transcription initiation factor TFIID subunit 3, partial [Ophiophagus hannah]